LEDLLSNATAYRVCKSKDMLKPPNRPSEARRRTVPACRKSKNSQKGVSPPSRHPDAAAFSYSVNMNSLDTCPHFLYAPMMCARRSPLGRTRPVRFDGLRHTRLLPKSCPRNINPFDYALSLSHHLSSSQCPGGMSPSPGSVPLLTTSPPLPSSVTFSYVFT